MSDLRVGSLELEMTRRLFRRRILVIITLVYVSDMLVGMDIGQVETYNPPSAKTAMRAYFCLLGSWSD